MLESVPPTSPSFGDAYEDFRDAASKGGGGHPLATIWFRPRATLRGLLKANPTYLVIPLACAWGISQTLSRAASRNMGDKMSTSTILMLAFVVGSFGGIAGVYLFGWIWSWAGKMLGGGGEPQAVRAAIAWGQTPVLAILAVQAVQLALLGDQLFTRVKLSLLADPNLRTFYFATLLANLFLLAWMAFTFLKCLGEAHGFSAWRALGAFILGSVAFLAPVFAGMMLIVALMGIR